MCRYCWDASQFLPERGRKRGWGDTIDYLRHFRGLSFQEAKRLASEGQSDEPAARSAPPVGVDYRDAGWQEAMAKSVHTAEQLLWEPKGIMAWEFAHRRGLTDETIRGAHLGYSNGDIPRLVVPTFNRGRYVAVSGRDLRPDVPKEQRWKDTSGSRKIEFYGLDALSLRKGMPVVLVEDAFSALSIIQECRQLVNAVATGGVGACHSIEMVATLAVAPLVLVAFDADASGDDKATWWLKRLNNAKRLRPLLKDANDMLMAGWDLRQWIEEPLPQLDPTVHPLPCSVCGADARTAPDDATFSYDEQGVLYCPTCWASRFLVVVTTDKEALQRDVEQLIKRLPEKWQDPHLSDAIHKDDVAAYKQASTDSYRQASERPAFECRICKASNWISYAPEGWICFECLSPAYTQVTLQRQNATQAAWGASRRLDTRA